VIILFYKKFYPALLYFIMIDIIINSYSINALFGNINILRL